MKIFMILFLAFNLYAYDDYLKSQDRAEVYAQNLLEAGEYKKIKEFLIEAKEKYPKSESLLMFSATAEYELKNFDEAKLYFMKTLELNPKNEQASHFKELIEKQESALKNSDIESLFSYLNDKGLDFLSIFLAFLGGEIIAKRFGKCSSIEERNLAFQYRNRDLLNTLSSRFVFTFKNYFNIHYTFSFCFFLNLLIVFVISSSILIFILLFELITKISVFSSNSLLYMNSTELEYHIWFSFVISLAIVLLFRFFMYIHYLKDSTQNIELEIIQYLENMSSENKLDKMYYFLENLNCKDIKEIESFYKLLSDDCKSRIDYILSKIECKI